MNSMATDTDDDAVPSESDNNSESSSPQTLLPIEPKPDDFQQRAVDVGTARRNKGVHGASREAPSDLEDDDGDDEDDDDDEDEQPRLKYAYLTSHLAGLYRHGDATSAFLAGGDKMFIGTHNGKIHVLSLPSLRPLRAYQAHTASVTSISVSPWPPPLPSLRPDSSNRSVTEDQLSLSKSPTDSLRSASRSKGASQQSLAATPSNSIYIATSSIDGNVCIFSLVDLKDILFRNFGRPVHAVALSPDYRRDRTYLSGGRAGQLVLTVGGRIGASTNSSTIGGAANAASGWLGSIGLGANAGKDTVLHSGEGTINAIKWSLSGKYVAWVNEEGIKIARTYLHLETADAEHAWTRICHIDRPDLPEWEEMASVWRAHLEWVDEYSLKDDIDMSTRDSSSPNPVKDERKVERLVVGWGGTVWIIKVYPDRLTPGSRSSAKRLGAAEVYTMLRADCIISGVSMYTSNLLLVLAYIESEEQQSDSKGKDSVAGGKKLAEEPELRLIDIDTQEEVSTDTISVSRFKNLSSSDYHMSVLPAPKQALNVQQRGALEFLSNGLLDATMYPARLFSSAGSIRSNASSGNRGSENASGSLASTALPSIQALPPELKVISESKGVKIFIHSPYDCVVAVEGDLTDRLAWLESRAKYEEAWHLIDEHPEAADSSSAQNESAVESASRSQNSLAEFFADDASSVAAAGRAANTIVEKEKRRIGELWIQQLIDQNHWEEAAAVCSKVLGITARWEHWIWIFIKKDKFDEITPHIPISTRPPLASGIYEAILGHYVSRDRERFKELLDKWPVDLFDSESLISVIEEQLRSTDTAQESKDWQILMDSLAKLLLANGRHREALRCYIRLQDAEAALGIIRDFRLVDAVSDDIPGFLMLRVSKEQLRSASISELDTATSEPIKILVAEAYNGIISPETVVTQLQAADRQLFLFFYLRALWKGESRPSEFRNKPHLRGRRAAEAMEKLVADEGRALVEPYADVALELFADYDRELFMDFLQSSTAYSFSAACTVCEIRGFTPELIYLLSKTGEVRKALNLILSDLQDVSQAIAFAKSQDDPDLWEDLLNYSMDKPRFIHGLLTEAGTSVDPIKLVRRIPSGLEIEGLRDGLTRMIREHDLQASISEGAAKVLRSEVAIAMDTLRRGQRQGIKFDVTTGKAGLIGEGNKLEGTADPNAQISAQKGADEPMAEYGRCGGCRRIFHEDEKEILVGFACGHVFHLSHLHATSGLEQEDPSNPDLAETTSASPRVRASSRPSLSDDEENTPSSRTVGPKVITARLIRDKVGSGCRICALGKEVENASAPAE